MASCFLGLACLALLSACSGLGAWDLIAKGSQSGTTTSGSNTTPDTTICHMRMKVSLNNLYEGETLNDFPLLIKLSPSISSGNIDYSLCSSGGADLRFKDSSLNALSYEIESWDPSGYSYIWVKVPTISSINDYIWLYFDSSNPQDRSDPKSVWSNRYVGVWHGASLAESTGRLNSSATGYAAPTFVAGQIGKGFNFDGASRQGIITPAISAIADLGPITLEAWVYNNGTANGQAILSKGPFCLSMASSGTVAFNAAFSSTSFKATSASILSSGNWVDFGMTWDGASACSFYAHGTNLGSTSSGPVGTRTSDSSSPLIIGNTSSADIGINAVLDEIRISGTIRDATWMMAQYRSQAATTITFGATEPAP